MNNIKFLATIFMIMFMLSACEETMEGAGKDVEDVGENIQDAAK